MNVSLKLDDVSQNHAYVMAQQISDRGYKYIGYDDVALYDTFINEPDRYFEVIKYPARVFMDFDDVSPEHVSKLVELNPEEHFRVYINSENTRKFHVYGTTVHKDPLAMKIHVQSMTDSADMSVYRYNGMFRLPENRKKGRTDVYTSHGSCLRPQAPTVSKSLAGRRIASIVAQAAEPVDCTSTMISMPYGSYRLTSVGSTIRHMFHQDRAVVHRTYNHDTPLDMSWIESKFPQFTPQVLPNGNINLKRNMPSKCPIDGHTHDHIDLLLKVKAGKVFLYCPRAHKQIFLRTYKVL